MLLFYISHDGQARRIAARIAERLTEEGQPVHPRDLAMGLPGKQELLAGEGPVVLVAAVRYGRHLPEGEAFAALFATLKTPPPLILFSVNLTARKPEKRTAEGSTYLRKLIGKHQLKPILARAIAGKLDYPRYRPFDRVMIRFIMWMTGGPTDPRLTIEFTDWQEVDALARQTAALATR